MSLAKYLTCLRHPLDQALLITTRMKMISTFALVALLAAPALAAQPTRTEKAMPARATSARRSTAQRPAASTRMSVPKASATKMLTSEDRADIAMRVVERDLKPWVHHNTNVIVRPAIVPFDGDLRNPITGAGPVQIFVTQKTPAKGLIGKVRSFFNPFRKQTYLVNVDPQGHAQILDRISLAPQRRFASFFRDKLALGSIASDLFHSGKMSEALFTAVGASGAAFVNPILSGALWMRVAQVVGQGISSQNKARKTALHETVAWAKTGGKGGDWPTLMESYREYQAHIEASETGAAPVSLSKFAEQLSINRL